MARRSSDRADGPRPLHMVSPFLVREGLSVAQEPCDAKSNEITVLPRLLACIHLQGAVVTMDAAGCQTVERNGGGRERRRCTVLGGPGLGEWVVYPEAWPGLRSLIRVQAERIGPRGRRQRSVRYYISSRPVNAAALLELIRGHWGVENGLHRPLDVQFREDDCRIRSLLPESREFGFASLWVYLNVASMSNDPLVELQLMSRSTSPLSARLPNLVMGTGNGTDVLSRP